MKRSSQIFGSILAGVFVLLLLNPGPPVARGFNGGHQTKRVTLLANNVNIFDGVYIDGDEIYTTCGGLYGRKNIGVYTAKAGFKIVSEDFAGTIDIVGDAAALYVTNYDDNTIKKYDRKSKAVTTITTVLDGPAGIELMPDGYLYVTNFGAPPAYAGNTIYKIAKSGQKELFIKDDRLNKPQGLAKIDDNMLAVSNSQEGKIFLLNTKTKTLTLLAEAKMPVGNMVFVDNVIYAASNRGNQILKIDLKGIVTKECCTADEGEVTNPLGIDYDAKNKRLIIAEARTGNLKAISLRTLNN